MQESPIRVLVFGSTGTGKTSLCNTLTGEHQRVSNSANGVTFQSSTFAPFKYKGSDVIVVDTIGLNESDKGTVSSGDAITALINLLKESKKGYNLLIQVMRMPRITKDVVNNYKFFYDVVSQRKIPIVLVVTGCENEEPMSKWVVENKAAFSTNELEYSEILATCFAVGGRFESIFSGLRNESKELVIDAIGKFSTLSPVTLYKDEFQFIRVLKRSWNWFCDTAKLNWHINILKDIMKILMSMGMSEPEARKKADEL